MTDINPFFTIKQKLPTILWINLIERVVYDFELILPLRAQTINYRVNSELVNETYLSVCARVCKHQKLKNSHINEDQLFVLGLPIKTTEKALLNLNPDITHQISDEVNVRFKFIKKSRQSLHVVYCEIMKPTEEQIVVANKYYSGFKPKDKSVVVRPKEEL